MEYYPDEPDTQEDGGSRVLGDCVEGKPQVENQSVLVIVDGIECEGGVGVLGDVIECEGECDIEIREEGTQADISVVLSDDLQCEAEGEGDMREDGVQCEVKVEGELKDVEVNCEGEARGELRDVEVTYEVEEDVGQTEIKEDGDVHSWTEFEPDDSMDESTDNLLDVILIVILMMNYVIRSGLVM